jgi:hypothetical protein
MEICGVWLLVDRTTHIVTKYHYIREQNGKAKMKLVTSEERLEDLLTKHVKGVLYESHKGRLLIDR